MHKDCGSCSKCFFYGFLICEQDSMQQNSNVCLIEAFLHLNTFLLQNLWLHVKKTSESIRIKVRHPMSLFPLNAFVLKAPIIIFRISSQSPIEKPKPNK